MFSQLASSWESWILAASWQLALLVVVLFVATLLLRRLPARFRYTLWLLVLFKALLPPSLGFVWGIGHWGIEPLRGEVERHLAAAVRQLDFQQPVSIPDLSSEDGTIDAEDPGKTRPPTDRKRPNVGARGWKDGPSLSQIPLSVWLAGVFLTAVAVLLRYGRVVGKLRNAEAVDEGPLRVALERLALGLGKSSPPSLLLANGITSPFLIGLFRPKIVLPANLPEEVGEEGLRNVLLHELVHWKRRDLAISWVQGIVQALFWFHPFVWFANARIREERESGCDETVLSLGSVEPKGYGESLLKVLLASEGRSSISLGYLGIFERGTKIQNRLEVIMKTQKSARKTGGVWGWALVVLFAAAVVPMAPLAVGDDSQTYIITFKPVGSFQPETASQMLGSFNKSHPQGVKAHHFRTTNAGGILLGYICVEGEEGKEAVLKAVEENAEIELVSEVKATSENLGAFFSHGQPSLTTKLTTEPKKRGWGPEQATGQPDTEGPGDIPTAWASLTQDDRGEWLLLEYGEPVKPSALKIHETFNPGAVTKVTLFNQAGEEVEAWKGEDPTPPGSGKGVSEIPLKVDFETSQVTVFLDSPAVDGWNEIDAVGLVDSQGDIQWATKASASSTFAERPGRSASSRKAAPSLPCETLPQHPLATVLKYDDGTAEGKKSYGGGGHAIRLERPDESNVLFGLEIFGSRYGYPEPPDEDFEIYVLDESLKVLDTIGKPYGLFERGPEKWVPIRIGNIPVPKSFWIALNFNAHQTKGVYVSYDTSNPESLSMSGRPDQGFEKLGANFNWMIRAHAIPVSASGELEIPQPEGGGGRVHPTIAATSPIVGATDVDPALSEITVTFDCDMNADGYSWTGGGPQFPKTPEGKRAYWKDARTCALPVELEEGHYYRVGINSGPPYTNFRSQLGVPIGPTAIYFTTQGASEDLLRLLEKPEIVETIPPNGAKDVDPNLSELRVTFSVPMGPDFSWCGGDEHYPKIPKGKRPFWTEDKKTCVLPVKLKPNWDYHLGINCPSYNTFQSEGGIPVEVTWYNFSTRGE